MYFCGICDDLEFTTKGRCLGHLREQHAGLQYKCLKCRKLFRRNDNPHICGARREDYIPFVMSTGEKGEAALRVLNQFMQNAEENLVIVRNIMLNEHEYEAKFEMSAGRGKVEVEGDLLIGSMWWITLQERGHNLLCRITVNVGGCPLLQCRLGLHLPHPARHLHHLHLLHLHHQHLPHLPLILSRLRLRQSSVKMRRN